MPSHLDLGGPLDLGGDVVDLLRALIDIESVSGNETGIADQIEAALRPYGHLSVVRDGNVIVARTELGRSERVVMVSMRVPFSRPSGACRCRGLGAGGSTAADCPRW